jgi:hypothetical protein
MESTFHHFHLFLHLLSLIFRVTQTLSLMMMMMVMTVSLRSNPVHLQLTGRRPLVDTRGGLSQDAPPITHATPPPLTVKDEHVFLTLTTKTTVVQGAVVGTGTAAGTSRAGGGNDIDWDDIQEE